MGLTFAQIQNDVLADGFAEADRAACKKWINTRHAWLWDSDEFVWRNATATVTFTAGSQTVANVPPDFRIAVAMYDSQGNRLQPSRDMRQFLDQYNANVNMGSGRPDTFTVFGNTIMVGPAGDGTTGILLYEKERTALVNDTDTTGLPDGYDLALVHGAKAEGFKLKKIPLWQDHEDEFAASVAALQRNYLTSVRGDVGQFGAYRPGSPVY